MDLTNLENALNNGNFKEQVYSSLEVVYQISKVLNQLDLVKNFSRTQKKLKRQSSAKLKATNTRRNEVFRNVCLWETNAFYK